MNSRCDFIAYWGVLYIVTSSYRHLKSENWNLIYSKYFLFSISRNSRIIDQFSLKFQNVVAQTFLFPYACKKKFILMTSSWVQFWLKATSSNFANLRVMSMGGNFFSKQELTWHYLLCNFSLISRAFFLKFWYIVA